MKLDSLEQLYLSDLRDLYDAEKQLAKALPRLARQVNAPKLKQGFERHARQTEEHAKRLEKIFQQHGQRPTGRRCPAMAGLVAEANETLDEDFGRGLLDVGVITAAQKVEHYEISGYSSAIALAETLGLESDIRLLQRTLEEEEQTEQQLSTLCEILVQQQHEEAQSFERRARQAPSGRGRGAGNSRGGTQSKRSSRSRAGSAQATRDHAEIRRWVEERGGAPASVRGTARGGQAGLLRIDFPGYSGERTLQHIDWDDWFEKFDEENLQFLYQDRTKDGRESRFFKLVCERKVATRRKSTSSR